jgi:hypothetical protein
MVALTHGSHPTEAWLATIGAATVVALDLAIYARVVRPLVDATAWQWLAIAVSLAAILAVATAVAYAASRPVFRGGRLTVEATIVRRSGCPVSRSGRLNNPSETFLGIAEGSPIGSLGVVTRTFLVATVAFTSLGVVGDVWPSAERAWRRAGLLRPAPAPWGARVRAWLPALADELSPGRRRARTAVLAERSRLAADLHADVVPGLRRVLCRRGRRRTGRVARLFVARGASPRSRPSAASATPSSSTSAASCRRWPWLAERIERRSDVSRDDRRRGQPERAAAWTSPLPRSGSPALRSRT